MTSRQLYDDRRKNPNAWFKKHVEITGAQRGTLSDLDATNGSYIISDEGVVRLVSKEYVYLIGRDGRINFQGRRGKGLT